MKKISIEKITVENLEAAKELANKIFKSTMPGKSFTASITDQNKFKSYFGADTHGAEYFVLKYGAKIIGTTGIYSFKRAPKTGWVGWFCIHPDFRKNGLGATLLSFTETQAIERGFTRFRLWTEPNAKAAHRLYKQMGLRLLKKEDDILIFGKNLK